MKHTIDAQGKSLGRIASQAAVILMGKNEPSYEPNKIPNVKVEIINASKTKISEQKLDEKLYERYSGRPGGFTEDKMAAVIKKKGYKEIYELAVYGMLPGNKLRPRMMKNLIVTE